MSIVSKSKAAALLPGVPDIAFPEGRTRFNAHEVRELVGIPHGSNSYLLRLIAELRVPCERIGAHLTYDRNAVRKIAALHATRRGARKPRPVPEPPEPPGHRRGRPRRKRPTSAA